MNQSALFKRAVLIVAMAVMVPMTGIGVGFNTSAMAAEVLNTDEGLQELARLLKVNTLEALRVNELPERVYWESAISTTTNVGLRHGDANIGVTRLLVRRPKPQRGEENVSRAYPVVFVIGGINRPEDILTKFPDSKDYILVLYSYPINPLDLPKTVPAMALRAVSEVPRVQAQIAVTLNWLSRRPEVVSDRINTIMVSFGTFISPLSLRVSKMLMGVPIYSNTFAFGGASIKDLILPEIKKRAGELAAQHGLDPVNADRDMRTAESALVPLFNFIDPKNHLPHVPGHVLVIHGEKDQVIPKASRDAVDAALASRNPEIVRLPVGHIGVSEDAIIEETMKRILGWYEKIGALY